MLRKLKYARHRLRNKGLSNLVSGLSRYIGLPDPSRLISRLVVFKYRSVTRNFPKIIQIETMSQCNYSCSFCPNSHIDSPQGRMSDELIHNIVEQLRDFRGSIHLHLRNEPLLDKRLEDICDLFASKTAAEIVIQTNGSLLSFKRAENLLKNATLIVNDYDVRQDVTRSLQSISHPNLIILNRSGPQRLSNRAGNLRGQLQDRYSGFCVRPFEQMYIAYDGRAIICCQDWMLETVMGNVTNTTIQEIWHNSKYALLREKLLKGNRDGICSRCDFGGL